MNRALRLGAPLFTFAALGLFLQGVAVSRRPVVDPKTWLSFDAETKSFGALPERSVQTVGFEAKNVGPRPLHILGSVGTCSPQGCVRGLGKTFEIQPGRVLTLDVSIGTREAGDFKNEVVLFTDCPGRAELPLTVTGQVVGGFDAPVTAGLMGR